MWQAQEAKFDHQNLRTRVMCAVLNVPLTELRSAKLSISRGDKIYRSGCRRQFALQPPSGMALVKVSLNPRISKPTTVRNLALALGHCRAITHNMEGWPSGLRQRS